jgi:hypothetical protein
MRHTRSWFGKFGGTPRLSAIALVLALAGHASAQITIDPSESVGSVPGFAGTGLSGNYYYFPNNSIGDLNQGDSLVAGASGPTGTFTTTNVCFPDCINSDAFNTSTGGFASFTNGNATNINYLVPQDQVPTTSFYQTVLQMNGYVAITTPGTYTFSITSDDGSSLTIGGTQIDFDDGIHGNQTVSNSVSFSAAGLYSLAIDYFQNGGGAELDLTAYTPQGTCYLGCQTTAQNNPDANTLFYSNTDLEGAPAPTVGGGLPGLAALGVLAAAALVRGRQRMA